MHKNVTICPRTKLHLPNPAIFFIIRCRNLKQTYVLRPSCCLSFCKYGTLSTVSLFPTTYCHSQFQDLQVSIAHTWNVRVSSMFLLLSEGNYTLRRRCANKEIGDLWKTVGWLKCINAMDRQTRMQELHGDVKFCILQSFPARQALGPCLSMLSVCPLASSIEPVDWFSWYKNLIYLKVTPTPHFKFYFPSISNNKMADTKVVWR